MTTTTANVLWTDAFYDSDYGKDQTRRLATFDYVVEFLVSLGYKVKWTAAHDGSDLDPTYGIHIAGIIYEGREYEHNACYNVRYELPPDLLAKLDNKFGRDPTRTNAPPPAR